MYTGAVILLPLSLSTLGVLAAYIVLDHPRAKRNAIDANKLVALYQRSENSDKLQQLRKSHHKLDESINL